VRALSTFPQLRPRYRRDGRRRRGVQTPAPKIRILSFHYGNARRRRLGRGAKWSRALRHAAGFKSLDEPLCNFIKHRGGLNACAARLARRLGRLS
jgi:hypothetical protein